jgi:transcriptional regulator with XRE-family HTH domain
MPRLNPARSVEAESDVARRITYERRARGLSYDGLAKLMTEAGCPIQGSAIYKIEKGDPPRRVTVNELVALSRVLDVPIEGDTGLLVPAELIDQRYAQEAAEAVREAIDNIQRVTLDAADIFTDLVLATQANPDLAEFVLHRVFDLRHTEDDGNDDDGQAGKDEIDDAAGVLSRAIGEYMAQILEAAIARAKAILADDSSDDTIARALTSWYEAMYADSDKRVG